MASSVKNLFFPLSAATVAFVAVSWLSAPTQLSATSARSARVTVGLGEDSPRSVSPTSTDQALDATQDAPSDSTSGLAEIRVSQWGADRPAIDVSIDGRPWASNLRSPATSDYLSVSAGRHRVVIAATDDIAGADEANGVGVDLRLESGARATLFPRPLGLRPGAVLVSDVIPKEVPDAAHLRVINLSEQQSTLWALSANGLEVTAEQRKSSGYVVIPTGTYTARISTSKTAPSIVDGISVTAAEGTIKTMLITDAGPSVEAVTLNDQRPGTNDVSSWPTIPTPDGTPPKASIPDTVAVTTAPISTRPSTDGTDTTSLSDRTEPSESTEPSDTTAPETTISSASGNTALTTVHAPVPGVTVPASLPPFATPDQLALDDRDRPRSSNDALIHALEGAGVALAVSEFVRRARRRNA
jgi:Domain of unknown function (DUF4397)